MKSTLFTLSNATVNAINEMNATCNSCRTRVFPNCVMIYGNVTFADGHKSFVNTQGKDMDTAEKNFLRCVIKRAVPKAMFEETCAKYNITPDAFNRKAKAEVQVEAKADIQVEAKTEVVVEKQAPAAIVTEIPRLETVRQSRSPKKLKAQKLAESTETTAVVKIDTTSKQIKKAASQIVTLPVKEANSDLSRLYTVTKSSFQQVGGKYFVNVPVELLFADYRYQRLTDNSSAKIRKLVERWNPAKMDALRVSFHDDENKIAVINGMHRLIAAKILGLNMIECEVINDLPQDPVERLKAEAFIFVSQNDEVELLKPYQKHNAGILIGAPEYVILNNVISKYGIELKKTVAGRGKCKAGELAGYSKALDIAIRGGEDYLDNIFNIICKSRWNLHSLGFSNKVLIAIYNVIRLHPDNIAEITQKCIEYMKPITPVQFIAESMSAYPKRKETEQVTLYLEDYLCDTIGMDRVYLADKGIERNSTVNTEVPVGVSAS